MINNNVRKFCELSTLANIYVCITMYGVVMMYIVGTWCRSKMVADSECVDVQNFFCLHDFTC